MCALAQAIDKRHTEHCVLSDIVLLSLGTGTSLYYIKGKTHDWGYAQWIKPLINLMMDGVSGIADYQCKQILAENYHRLAPIFPPSVSVSMDDVKKIPYMENFANGEVNLDDTINFLRNNWQDVS
ncbi:MAG: hypothetical protein L0Y79_13320 [Chlorobi bacterium]|nr:hypothetical protein [Chlorobiota bacterium]MCI0716249.1 hypothetical protein [Chlorobiota bacterium]